MIPTEFRQIYNDFARDLLTTFPELDGKIKIDVETDEDITVVFEHCKTIYPVRFFDILNKNGDIFNDTEIDTEFLPGIDFADLWQDEGLSDTTKEAIWKYLQLIMFAIIETIKTADSFGDTAKLFETMKEEDLKSKLEDTIKQMESMFNTASTEGDESRESGTDENTFNIDESDLPNPEDLHNHITGLMGGKLGELANEIAQETMEEFDLGLGGDENNDIKDIGDVFNKMFKNPGKLMNMVNNISGKLDSKMKNGDLDETELMKEATDLMGKMQNIPGIPNMPDMFKNMAQNMKNMSGSQKGAAQTKINLDQKMNTQKERMRRKLEERRRFAEAQAEASAESNNTPSSNLSDQPNKAKKKRNNKKRK